MPVTYSHFNQRLILFIFEGKKICQINNHNFINQFFSQAYGICWKKLFQFWLLFLFEMNLLPFTEGLPGEGEASVASVFLRPCEINKAPQKSCFRFSSKHCTLVCSRSAACMHYWFMKDIPKESLFCDYVAVKNVMTASTL